MILAAHVALTRILVTIQLVIQAWIPSTMDLGMAKATVEATAIRMGCERPRTMISWEGHGAPVLVEVRCEETEMRGGAQKEMR